MPLFLCALRDIKPAPTIKLPDGRLKLMPEYDSQYTLVKKDKYHGYQRVPELDTPYYFSDRKIYRFGEDVQDLFYWRDKLTWRIEIYNERKVFPFARLHGEGSINTMFAEDCAALSVEFRDWDAYIEHESKDDPSIYTAYQKYYAAVDFAKQKGALWYFQWDEDYLEEYFEAKKWYSAHQI